MDTTVHHPTVIFGKETSIVAVDSREKNRLFVSIVLNQANVMLVKRGHIFLNEIYDMLNLERTREGQLLGWLYLSPDGDGYIEFGEELYQDGPPELTLTFNVQGEIHDKF